jgi:hypothetical protein
VTVGGVTAIWSNTITVIQPPLITGISPSSGKQGATVNVVVSGQYLSGATFVLQSVDPADTNAGGTVTVVSNTGTLATLSLALGTTEGQFALIATTSIGANAVGPAALFLIGQANNSVMFDVSVLNTTYNPSTTAPLAAGQNSARFDASVLNTSYNPSTTAPLAAGQNSARFNASVLNTSYNTSTPSALPAGQNNANYYISVCNTSSGCTAMAPALLSANASPASTRPRPTPPPTPSPPVYATGGGALPVLSPLEGITSVTVGQTIRLGARNVESGSNVEFDVNQVFIAAVSEAPYETLFTVPDGATDLTFQIVVRASGQPERLSQITRMAVSPDSGAIVSGSVVPNPEQSGGGVELSLAAGGLKAEFFRLAQPVTALPSLEGVQPVSSGYVTAINEPNPGWAFGDDPLGVHLGSDYAVRFSGELRADEPGEYRFWLTARSGAAILIDGKPLADSGFTSGDPAEAATSLALDRGWHSIEVIYYLAVGPSGVRLDWQQPNGTRREALGPEYLRTVLPGATAISATDGKFVFTQVPRKFDTVWIRIKQGNDFIEFPAVTPGAGPVSIALPK